MQQNVKTLGGAKVVPNFTLRNHLIVASVRNCRALTIASSFCMPKPSFGFLNGIFETVAVMLRCCNFGIPILPQHKELYR